MKSFALLLAFIASISISRSQTPEYHSTIKAFQDTLNAEFRDPETSPLKAKDLMKFKELAFFPVDSSYRVIASIQRIEDSKPFRMRTTTSRVAMYRKWANVAFELNGEPQVLTVYQNQDLMKEEKYKDYLFLPFLDETNGEGSYSGGRYMDLELTDKDTIIIDFNKAYNPYCAYSDRYSCPVVPRKNRLKVEVKAGVKAYKK